MTSIATVTSKGQVTLPVAVRRALSVEQGDKLMFTVRDQLVFIAKNPGFLSLAGTVNVPASKAGAQWSQIVESSKQERVAA